MESGERAGERETHSKRGVTLKEQILIFSLYEWCLLFQRCTGERNPVSCISPQRIAGLATHTSHEN